MNRTLTYTVPEEFDGEKVNMYLRSGIGLSYRMVRSLKQIRGSMLLDGEPVRTIDRLRAGAVLTLNLPQIYSLSTSLQGLQCTLLTTIRATHLQMLLHTT